MTDTVSDPTSFTPPRPSLVRPLLALVAGLGIMVLIVAPPTLVSTLAALRGLTDAPLFRPPMGFILFSIALNIVGGILSGFVVARLTRERSRHPVLAMALLLFISAALDAVKAARSGGLLWAPVVIAVLVPISVIAGARLEQRRGEARVATE